MPQERVIRGVAFPAGSSRRIEAQMRVLGETGLVLGELDSGEDLAVASLSEVVIDPPVGRAPRRVTFADGSLFETDDHEAIEQLSGQTASSLLHHWETFHPRLIGVIAATCFAVFLVWRYGLDILAGAAVAITPIALTEQIDAGTLVAIDRLMASPTTLAEDEQARVQAIFTRLVDRVEPTETSFKLLFRSMPTIGPNAFAMPGGTVVMTDEFVKTFANDDVLAGVLGHELGHVVEQHGLNQLYRSLSIYILIAFLAGDTGPILEDVVLEGNLLLSLSYSRKHENSADQFGLRLADDAGFNPAGLRKFFEFATKHEAPSQNEWLSTHPSSERRMEAIDDYINGVRD